MASLLGVGKCGISGSLATGKPYCDPLKDKPFAAWFADEGVTFSVADMATQASFRAAYKLKCRAPRGSRIYPIYDLNNFEDKTSEPGFGSVGNLTTKQTRTTDPIPAFDFAHAGGELMHRKLLQLEVGNYDLFIMDANYTVYGTRTESGELKGYTCDKNYVYPSKFKGSDTVNQYKFSVQLSSFNEYRDLSDFFVSDAGVLSVGGMINVTLSIFSQTTNVAKILMIAEGAKNLFDLPGVKSAMSTSGSVVAVVDATGVSHTITSVVSTDAANKVFTVTLDSTQFSALSTGATVTIDLGIASALFANGIDKFESTGGVQVTK